LSSDAAHDLLKLQKVEELGVYLLLKEREPSLDRIMLALLNRIERRLYARYSIAEFENIKEIYKNTI
jgi:hypothetical protein